MDLGCSANFSSKCLINAVTGQVDLPSLTVKRYYEFGEVGVDGTIDASLMLVDTCVSH
jgi:hypothetical protein